MAKRVVSCLSQWCSRVFMLDLGADSVYFTLTKNPGTAHFSGCNAFQKIFGEGKSYSFHVYIEDRIKRAIFYDDLRNKLSSALPGVNVLEVSSFYPNVKNSVVNGFFVKDIPATSGTDQMLCELIKSDQVRVCTYVVAEDEKQWWQNLLSLTEDGRMDVIEKYCVIPAGSPTHHPSTLNIINSSVFYNFENAYKVLSECSDIIPDSKQVQERVNRRLQTKEERRFPVIAIEGLDATGKTTLTRSLTEALSATLLRSPPECLALLRPGFDSRPPLIRRAFYALGNYITAGQIAGASAQAPVIVDRYWHSTAAYAIATAVGGGLENLPGRGAEVYRWPGDLLRPDLVLLLTVSPEERVRRLRGRGELKTREETELEVNHLFRNKVEEVYKRMEDPACVVLDASSSPDEVLQKVLLLIKNKLPF